MPNVNRNFFIKIVKIQQKYFLMGIFYKNQRSFLTKQTKNGHYFVNNKHMLSEKIVNYYKRSLQIFLKRDAFREKGGVSNAKFETPPKGLGRFRRESSNLGREAYKGTSSPKVGDRKSPYSIWRISKKFNRLPSHFQNFGKRDFFFSPRAF